MQPHLLMDSKNVQTLVHQQEDQNLQGSQGVGLLTREAIREHPLLGGLQ